MATQTKAWDARYVNPSCPHDTNYYIKCIGGGVLACGTTHTAVCPLDVVKCNMQVSPERFKSLGQGMKLILAEEGAGATGLLKGWLPTFFGYSTQGAFKFGLYEVFKDFYANLAGEKNAEKYQGLIWLAGSASAEFFADMGLCPFEMVKVKVQTSPKGTFPTGMFAAMSAMRADPSSGFPFKSLTPLWCRQIPYTMAKFYFFEKVVRAFYQYVFTKPKEQYSKATQLSITFASGYLAGVICAIVSHPADTLVSARGKASNAGKGYGQIAKEMGYTTICTKGLGTRILMIGTLTGLQWWIYDSYKTALGMGTSGGSGKK
ncbi:putative mitochondrial mitochondrial phosphate transporter [Leptomonas pyrrhocoris]|uniref:Putative mitochondrial mitochondrial phosphate transporter n=1 Tax=Leptomonas pyrrhocoris TaxID=157538 RepID=A0A0N0E0K1_LEPPY|nr:putative mitochondrial mitochondrial phosphate transporter [Leptomonas pyrrhocoris]XP_015664982.1 putative mitochondrial mitochondrial phosphate transporter [Leptomonas pyrrhocoris]KPA86542.1 putative mitochondrial mitochondrial phosphate transporter [Leptomonas pyrrhocoris]KPA86543.1 putative mitochondrial mitochondrial phosphate transporter [Leptomonas pyrrhocoris]|eukprot:XP_015664981.1 putative mitochondrial mitochondrial phosphate transporter [Leptomonas pyrrhocoris]